MIVLISLSCNSEDMNLTTMQASIASGDNITPIIIPTDIQTNQVIGGQTPEHPSVRDGALFAQGNIQIHTFTGFKTSLNGDGEKSDVVMKRSFDGGVTFQNEFILIYNNDIVSKSRVYSSAFIFINGELYIMYVSIDTNGNLTDTTGSPNSIWDNRATYVTDTLIARVDNWENPLIQPTISTSISLLSHIKDELIAFNAPATYNTWMWLPGTGNGIVLANGNAVMPGYTMFDNAGTWRQNPVFLSLLQGLNPLVATNWRARSMITGVFANETTIYEYPDNTVNSNTRKGNNEERIIRQTTDLGVTYTTPSWQGTLIDTGASGSVAVIPASIDDGRPNTMFLYSNVEISNPRQNSRIWATFDRNLPYVEVYELNNIESDGYTELIFEGTQLIARDESADGDIDSRNLTHNIADFYSLVETAQP